MPLDVNFDKVNRLQVLRGTIRIQRFDLHLFQIIKINSDVLEMATSLKMPTRSRQN